MIKVKHILYFYLLLHLLLIAFILSLHYSGEIMINITRVLVMLVVNGLLAYSVPWFIGTTVKPGIKANKKWWFFFGIILFWFLGYIVLFTMRFYYYKDGINVPGDWDIAILLVYINLLESFKLFVSSYFFYTIEKNVD